jgi:hypothetical protein
MLFPHYVPRPSSFWNPGDSDPVPLTITDDVPDGPKSAQISFEFLAAGQRIDSLPYDAVIAQDNSPANNGGYSTLRLHADGYVTLVHQCGDPFADADQDGDVDQDDFGVFQECADGYIVFMPICECFDRPLGQGDFYIDQNDYDAFEACASGPGILADANCDD